MTLFFGLLATLCQLGVLVAVVLAVGGRFSPSLARARSSLAGQVGPQALGLATAIAATSMLGSLYLSEVADYPPCQLCWYQRIAMYPLVVVLGVGAVCKDLGARLPAAIIAATGAVISSWHLLVERYPTLSSGSCEVSNPCSIKWVEEFGYLTIPGMALSGFLAILVLLAVARVPDAAPDVDVDEA